RAAYEYYRRQDRLADSARLPPMAVHAARSGLKLEAGRLYLDLAARAGARHGYLDAELLYKNALENLPEEERLPRIAATQGRAQMRYRLGRNEDAVKDFDAALELARQVGSRSSQISALLDVGIVLDMLHEWPRAQAATEEAEALIAADEARASPAVQARLV